MKDTSIKIEKLFHKLYRNRSGEERLIMGCSMFDTSKQIVISSIKHKKPNINKRDLRIGIFNQFYGRDFNIQVKQKIKDHLKALQ